MNEVNEILIKALRRLDDEELMESNGAEELKRSNAIKGVSMQIIDATRLNLKIFETAMKYGADVEELKETLKIND